MLWWLLLLLLLLLMLRLKHACELILLQGATQLKHATSVHQCTQLQQHCGASTAY
jgi:hypothetical protein